MIIPSVRAQALIPLKPAIPAPSKAENAVLVTAEPVWSVSTTRKLSAPIASAPNCTSPLTTAQLSTVIRSRESSNTRAPSTGLFTGESVGAIAWPDKVTLRVPSSGSSLSMLKAPVIIVPALPAAGVKLTIRLRDSPGLIINGRRSPDVVSASNAGLSVSTALTVSGPSPILLRVKTFSTVDSSSTSPNSRLSMRSISPGSVGITPRPVTLTITDAPALLSIETIPEKSPSAIGAKPMKTV